MCKKIEISEKPDNVSIAALKITKNKCLLNSYFVAENNKNLNIDIVEGAIIIYDKNSNGTVLCHAWNCLDNIHFDVTIQTDNNYQNYHKDVSEIKYVSLEHHKHDIYKNANSIEFSDNTIAFVKGGNAMLEKKT
ncbi:hypothetical protein KO02_13390 [Sphingobacterium sp. ML3W]|uniref:hypothetical protein n=1 Tax=Sphingobacterium sp. ML3W TaxID=1538644 RepID=UPI0004F8AAEA|nr:hypothetical protein [Sphingobacterium sp. ML3W]AIM37570.1 hypothetical protein KO02_13390 [Sphingobacterium sp. ML3W]